MSSLGAASAIWDQPGLALASALDGVCWLCEMEELRTRHDRTHVWGLWLRALAQAVAREDLPAACQGCASSRSSQDGATHAVYEWLRYLLSPRATRHDFLLQQQVIRDGRLYQGLVPRPRADSSPLPAWLTRRGRLTLVEVEVVLVVFDPRKGSEPTLAPWAHGHPQILWQVHDFLLERYCFDLLPPLRRALSTAGLWRPAYRAGEFTAWYPRVAGLTAIGHLAILGADTLQAMLYAAPPLLRLVTATSLLALLTVLLQIDVHKQNPALIAHPGQSRWRLVRLLGIFLAWSAVQAAAILATLACFQRDPNLGGLATQPHGGSPGAALGNLVHPNLVGPASWDLLSGAATATVLAAFLGALLQWFWEDASLADPV